MKQNFAFLPLCGLAALLFSCSKPDLEINIPDIDFTMDYTWPTYSFDQSLTSDKTFKMIVREFGTGIPVKGARLVFISNGQRTDSLFSNADGEILITGHDVGASKCLVGGSGYWAHGSMFSGTGAVGRLDSVYRTPVVDSVVTYLFPLSWVRLSITNSSSYPDSTYHETKTYQPLNGNWAPLLIATIVNPAKDTTVHYPVYGNDTVKVSVVLWQGITQLKFVESAAKHTGRGDTTDLEIRF